GAMACQSVARAAPDGYTLMVGYVATHATNPAVRKVPYDPVKDFTPIAMVGGTQNLLVVGPALSVADLNTFLEYARSSGGKLAFGSGGVGTLNHLIMEQFMAAGGFAAVTALYCGVGLAWCALLGGYELLVWPCISASLRAV